MPLDELIAVILLQAALVIGLSRLMGRLFAALSQPQVVGEMAAGIMLGPSVLGLITHWMQARKWTAHNGFDLLFPAQSIEPLGVLSQLGVIFFLFLVGLELDPGLIRNRGKTALAISYTSIAAPFAMGVIVTLSFPALFIGTAHAGPLPVALFMGAAISITAFPVLARILTERNLHRTKVGALAVTCAAVNDGTAWCMLPFIVAIASAAGSHAGLWPPIRTALLSVSYVLVMVFVAQPFLQRLQSVHDRQGRLSQNVLAVIILLTLGSAWVTERIGIHALFGAFLMGAIMPKGTEFVRTLAEKIQDFTIVFLLPIFFAYTGLKTQIGLLNSPGVWLILLVVVLAACTGKFGGATLAGRLCGLSWREAGAVGILLNTHGLMELVILTVGREMGVISDVVFAMMVLMALVTTSLTTPILQVIYPRRLFDKEYPGYEGAGAKPPGRRPRRRDAYTILIPVADPRSGGPLLHVAELLLGRPAASESDEQKADEPQKPAQPTTPLQRIVALHLRRPVEYEAYQIGPDGKPALPTDEVSLQPLLEQSRERGLPVEPISFISSDVPQDIARVTRERGVDLILMGFHRSVLGRNILGGTVHRVLTEAPCNVGVFVDHGFQGAGRVMVPFLGNSHDRLALELAAKMGRNSGTQITVVHVVPPDRDAPAAPADAKLHAGTAVERVFNEPETKSGVRMKIVRDASPVDAVIRESAGFDLVVVGLGEEWGLESHLFGLRTERIALGVETSLLMVRKHEAMRSTPQDRPTPAPPPPSSEPVHTTAPASISST